MKHKQTIAAATLGLFVLTAFGLGGGGNDFDMSWFTIDSGGGSSLNGDLELHGSIGQPDAGGPLTGGDFSLVGGFWAGAGEVTSACPEDLDGDGAVAFGDLILVLSAWGACPVEGACPEDLDGDGDVAFSDLLILLAAWGPCPS